MTPQAPESTADPRRTPAILEALARRYERTQGGRTGTAARDMILDAEDLFAEACTREGERRALAEHDLHEAVRQGILRIDPLHRRDPKSIGQIRFSLAQEPLLYSRLGRPSPTEHRRALATLFETASAESVPERWRERWWAWCHRMQRASLAGDSIAPFERTEPKANRELLNLLPRLLAWEGESLVRFASCVLCGDSKRLEDLATYERDSQNTGQLRGKLGRILSEISGGQLNSLDDLGIVPNPRSVLVHGPLQLRFGEDWLNLDLLQGPCRFSQVDVFRVDDWRTAATRCLTVENETTFHELAKLRSGELLVQTSFPGAATLEFLKRLPTRLEFWHFGDSDEAGFEILRVLTEKTGRLFQPLHMERGRVPFEQEALGRPTQPVWPFY